MVSTVTSQDVIHAGSKLIPAIFKVMMDPGNDVVYMYSHVFLRKYK